MTGEDAVCERYVAYAIAGQRYIAGRIWHVLRDASSLAEVFGALGDDRVEVAPSVYKAQVRAVAATKEPSFRFARPGAQFPIELAFHEEHGAIAEFAELIWNFAAHLVKHRSSSMGAYDSIPPGQCAALLARKSSLRHEALQEQRAFA